MGSRSSSTTSNPTTNYADNRNVIDAGGGVAGTGNQWDQSVSAIDNSSTAWDWQSSSNTNSGNTTSWQDASTTNSHWAWDGSQRTDVANSGNTSTDWNWDGSDRSTSSNTDNSTRTNTNSGNTTWTSDSSDRSTTTVTNNITDGHAFDMMTRVSLAQTEAARDIARAGFDASSATSARAIQAAADANMAATNSATASARTAADSMGAGLRAALGFAETSSAQSYASNRAAMGMQFQSFDQLARLSGDVVQAATRQADNATGSARAAFSTAQDSATGTRTLMFAGLAVVAVVFLMRKG